MKLVNHKSSIINYQFLHRGQALITLLVFTVISIIITTGAVSVIIINSKSTSKFQQGVDAYYVAESGAENGLLRLLRDPSYTGETLTVGDGIATISVTGTSTKTLTSVGKIGNFTKTIQITATYVNNILSIRSWKEI